RARAFSMGLPFVPIHFAENPLDGIKYGTGDRSGTWSAGTYGTALVLIPAVVEAGAGKPVMRHVIPEWLSWAAGSPVGAWPVEFVLPLEKGVLQRPRCGRSTGPDGAGAEPDPVADTGEAQRMNPSFRSAPGQECAGTR